MKTSFFLSFLRGLFLFASCVACKSDDSPDVELLPEPTTLDLLINTPWRLYHLQVSPPRAFETGSPEITDWFAAYTDCQKDNLVFFYADGTYIFDEGDLKCNVNDPQSSRGTWTPNPDETIITVTVSIFNLSYQIEQITPNELWVTRQEDFFGTIYTFDERYQRIEE